jgi:hypothetical protein
MKVARFAVFILVLALPADFALAHPQRSCSQGFVYCLRNCMTERAARFPQSECSIRCNNLRHKCLSTGCFPRGCGFTRS